MLGETSYTYPPTKKTKTAKGAADAACVLPYSRMVSLLTVMSTVGWKDKRRGLT